MALVDNKTLAVINDNDFGIRPELVNTEVGKKNMDDYEADGKGKQLVDGKPTEAKIVIQPLDKPESENDLWIIRLPKVL